MGVFFCPGIMEAAEQSQRLVKVGCFEKDPLYDRIGNDGNESYLIEFLSTLSHYTDYEFEPVLIPHDQARQSLLDGVIDVMPFCGRELDSSNDFLFSDIPTATGATVLASNRTPDFTGLRIGLNANAPDGLAGKIQLYAGDQGIQASYYRYESQDELKQELYNGKIDVFATIDFSMPKDFSVVATIETTFLYLAVRKGDQALFENLNQALTTLFSLNPSFLSSLRLKYIPAARYSINRLSLREQRIVREHNVVRIAALTSQAP